jgi:hypothetical protein
VSPSTPLPLSTSPTTEAAPPHRGSTRQHRCPPFLGEDHLQAPFFHFSSFRLVPHRLLSLPELKDLTGAAAIHRGARAASGRCHAGRISPPPLWEPLGETPSSSPCLVRCPCILVAHAVAPTAPCRLDYRRQPRRRVGSRRGDRLERAPCRAFQVACAAGPSRAHKAIGRIVAQHYSCIY